ncbi:MAG TPA: molybdopterin cofactor-binding domain-containing protein [Steroidobacteraceae bacterium]|nr:molybdopterin cofactor-binding domain-containing protein [Steroidobacteraceae bacterium]
MSSGIALSFSRAALAESLTFDARETLPANQSWNPAATGAGRIDGPAKVLGTKLYASDFRAADLPGWPPNTSHALLIRATDATHVFTGVDLSRLSGALKPSRVVTAADLAGAGIRVPAFFEGDLFCPTGKTPLYLGQPLVMLIFEQFDAFDQARLALRSPSCVSYGDETGPVAIAPYGSHRFVRIAGATPEAPDVYSPFLAGWTVPRSFANGEIPVWAPADREGPADAQATYYGEQIRAGLAANNPELLVLDREFETQSIDPMFLEPESGLGWYNAGAKTLELVLGMQSPYEAAEALAYMVGDARAPFKPAHIKTLFAYMGGGFGGRDHSIMPLYIVLAAMFFPDRPVRLAINRYEQFQSGIKRHAFKMRTRIGIDRATGKISGFAADHVLDGGGLANYSNNVSTVSAIGAIGVYDVPKVDIATTALHSRGVTAGSMRGYGTLQTMTALEVLIDEAAAALPLDPIEFRRRNALKSGGRIATGSTYSVAVRTAEILDKVEKHPIWQQRTKEKARGQQGGILVGTGVAIATKNYGSGADCAQSTVEIDAQGRIAIHSDHVDMGNGIGTALANRVAAHLGGVADDVTVHDIDTYGPLGLVTSGNSYTMNQATQDAVAENPRWVPAISAATFASNGAHVGTQAAAEAARVIFRFGLWPAALDLWGIAPTHPTAKQWEAARWKDGNLLMPGLGPLSLPAIAAKAHVRHDVTGAMAHAFSRWGWSRATFPIAGQTWSADIDALAVRKGGSTYACLDRSSVKFPPTANNRSGPVYTAGCATLVRVEIERASGVLRIAKAYSVLECGNALVPEIVVGQAQGGFAMGVGYALLESLPLYEDGPGNGKWNLGRYVIARASDLPLGGPEIEVLPALTPTEPPRGMAEVVMIPIVPAILNAIYDATGHRFQSLPVSQAMIKGVLP